MSKAHKHIDKKLMRSLKWFAAICLIMLMLTLFDLLSGQISLYLASLGLIVGVVAGLVAGRISQIVWHEDDAKVIGRLDATGLGALIVYGLLALTRQSLFTEWAHGPAFLAITFAALAGIMLGRLLVMSLHIRRVLVEQGLIR